MFFYLEKIDIWICGYVHVYVCVNVSVHVFLCMFLSVNVCCVLLRVVV